MTFVKYFLHFFLFSTSENKKNSASINMVLQHFESPINAIKNELSKRISREYWPQKMITRGEISNLLFGHKKATLKEIASYLCIQISDERRGMAHKPRKVFAIDIETNKVARVYRSMREAFLDLLISPTSTLKCCGIYHIMEKEYAFSLEIKLQIFRLD